jgi:hypothetical protein
VPALRVPSGRGSDAPAHVAGRALVGGWGRSLGVCDALAKLLEGARRSGDKARIRRIQTTQKAKGCRHSRNP